MISAHSVKKIMVLIRKSIVSCEFQDKLMCETWKTAICQQHLRSKFSHAGKEICISYGASINYVDRILGFFYLAPLSLTILQKAYGSFRNHVDSEGGRGVPEKTMSVQKGEGVLEHVDKNFHILQHLLCCTVT